MEDLNTADYSSRYRSIVEVPEVSDATILDNSIQFQFSQPVLSQEKKQTVFQHFIPSPIDSKLYVPIGFPISKSEDIRMAQYSPSRKYLALVRKSENKDDMIEVSLIYISY